MKKISISLLAFIFAGQAQAQKDSVKAKQLDEVVVTNTIPLSDTARSCTKFSLGSSRVTTSIRSFGRAASGPGRSPWAVVLADILIRIGDKACPK